MYKYVLFDLDGTLTDPGEGITNSVIYALKRLGIEVPPRNELYKFIGPPLALSFKEFYGFDEKRTQEAVTIFREYFSVTGIFENEVYDGIPEVLEKLKSQGIKLIVATSKPEEFAIRILDKFNLSQYFDIVCGSAMDQTSTDKSVIIKKALDKANIDDLSSAIMIGDRKHDIYGAKANNIKSIGVLFGYGSREEFTDAGADYIIGSPEEVLSVVL